MIGLRGGPQATSSVYVCNLPAGTDEALLAEHFGQIGVIKKDKRHGRPKIWIYRDKASNEPKGDATVTYEDPHAASAAVEWFDNKEFHGNLIRVSIAESKARDAATEQQLLVLAEPTLPLPLPPAAPEVGDGLGGAGELASDAAADGGRGRGRGGDAAASAKCWQQEGDWPCPNPRSVELGEQLNQLSLSVSVSVSVSVHGKYRWLCIHLCALAALLLSYPLAVPWSASCGNINFAFRGSCNRCGASRPSSGSGGGGGGRGRGRGADSAGRGGRGSIFGPNDWSCPMCGNTNWAKRTKCNICNTTKPGHTEGGVREGRAGGYKEFDEAEIEETKRRRKELEEDDGEMYDEFGNLKKKFRLKSKQGEAPGQSLGTVGWDKEDLGYVEIRRDKRNKEDHNGARSSDEGQRRSYRERYDSDRYKERDYRERNRGKDQVRERRGK
ncbi:transcription initiation factor TFIID subunit 15 isoform X2 [Selaginella moellendorffii]|uniref:transcription initiation factor TFIID subunit 15 isoform X2 n=1 Tax=Selaginella moellendorffii TaxID=88036 RepID=UPI000D1CD7BD|nr:transcription initiation factor TFIID subunit 15 isoform X2 [Selaginella moellendorffii]|eukprot:XP_024544996.1 transcription initiation factor TFIID subunit 15 isoform X2 [Selaginella moellendorffii]